MNEAVIGTVLTLRRVIATIALKVFLVGLLVSLYGLLAFAQESNDVSKIIKTDIGRKAYEDLQNEGVFALGGTGYSGAIYKGEKNLDILL
jgi:hypothetical protein